MSINRTTQLSRLACITVTFNPDLSLLQTQLAALAVDCPKVIVDNASSAEIVKQIETMINATPNARLLRNSQNEGLGAAVNAGIGFAKANWPDARLALLLDQDSEPRPGSIETLHNAFESLETQGRRVGCVGPTLIDAVTGSQHGFHQCSRWRWKRVYPPAESTVPVLCANLNGSGTLVSIELFQELGGLDETLFIDHVDTEWSFRVLHAGYGLWGIPNAIFAHRMGQDSMRFWWFGWHLWPSRSPQRHYYLFRNAVTLMRKTYVPKVWKSWAVAKLVMTATVAAIAGPQRSKQLINMTQGIVAGIRSGDKPHG